jgi:hypothetical protein
VRAAHRFWTDLIYSWPWHPRDGDKLLTRTDRVVVTIIVICTDLTMFLVISYGLANLASSVGVESDAVNVVDSGIAASSCANCTSNVTLVPPPPGVSEEQKEADRLANESMSYLQTFLVGLIPSLLKNFLRWFFSALFGCVQGMKGPDSTKIGAQQLLACHRCPLPFRPCDDGRSTRIDLVCLYGRMDSCTRWWLLRTCRRCNHAGS